MNAPLTNLQHELLHLFAQDVSDEDLHAIKRLLARYFADRATEGMDALAQEKGLTENDFVRWASEHERTSADRS